MQDYSRYPSHRTYIRKKRQKVLFFLLCLLVIFFGIGIIFAQHKQKHVSVAGIFTFDQPQPSPTDVPTPTPQTISTSLEKAVNNALSGTNGSYGIVVKNLKTGEYYGFNADTSFESGSLYKLWVMAVVYELIEKKKIHLSDTLTKNAAELYKEFDIDAQDQDTSTTISDTVQDALYQMITISDNDSALLLTDKVHVNSIQSFLQKNGFSESHVGINGNQPVSTAKDIAIFLEKLYDGKLGNQDSTDGMITLLKNQKLNEKLPQNLPNNIEIAHKTGEIDDYTHDAGIVYAQNGNYIIVVLTKSDDTQAANDRISAISQAVYQYFSSSHL